MNDIIAGIKRTDQLFFQDSNAFLVTCVRTKCEEVTPSRYSGGYLNTRFAVGKKEGDWYALKQFLKVGNSDDDTVILPNKQKLYVPPEPKITVVKKGRLLDWNQAGRPLIVIQHFNQPSFEGRNIFASIDYFRQLGLNVGKHIAEAENIRFDLLCQRETLKDYLDHPFLPEYLEQNSSKYSVSPKQEEVDGFLCWVVEYPGMDKLWIDAERGYVVRKRVYHWAPGKPRKFAIHNKDFREIKPGLWLPYQQVVDKYASIISEGENIWDKVACRLFYELETAAFDSNVPDDIFNVTPEVGTYVMDGIREIEYTVSDPDADPFAGPIAAGKAALVEQNRFVVIRSLCVIAVNIVVIIAVWLILRQQKKRNGTKHNDKKSDE